MAVWKDVELASPHNEGACQPLVRDCDAQGDGSEPVGGRGTERGGEVEARQDRRP